MIDFKELTYRHSQREVQASVGKHRTEATSLLSAVRALNRIEWGAETRRLALEAAGVLEQSPCPS